MTDRRNPYSNSYFYRCLFFLFEVYNSRNSGCTGTTHARRYDGNKKTVDRAENSFDSFSRVLKPKKKFIFILGVGVYESRTSYIYVYVSTRIISIEEDDAEERDIAVIKGVSPFENDLCVGGAEIQTGARTSSRTQTHRK